MRVPKRERIGVRQVLPSGQAPMGVSLAVCTVGVLVGVVVGALVPTTHPAWRTASVCLALLLAGAGTADLGASACAAGLAFLLTDGFLVNRLGEISWHGMSDVDRAVSLMSCAVTGWAVGAAAMRMSRSRRFDGDLRESVLSQVNVPRDARHVEVRHG